MVTFAVMTVVALVTSALTSREKEMPKEPWNGNGRHRPLYLLTSHLTEAKELSDAAETAVSVISDLLDCRAACLCYDETGEPEKRFFREQKKESL